MLWSRNVALPVRCSALTLPPTRPLRPAKDKAAVLGGGCGLRVDGSWPARAGSPLASSRDCHPWRGDGRLCAERVGALVVSEDGRRITGIISGPRHHLGHRRTWCWRGEGACAHGDDRARDHLQGRGHGRQAHGDHDRAPGSATFLWWMRQARSAASSASAMWSSIGSASSRRRRAPCGSISAAAGRRPSGHTAQLAWAGRRERRAFAGFARECQRNHARHVLLELSRRGQISLRSCKPGKNHRSGFLSLKWLKTNPENMMATKKAQTRQSQHRPAQEPRSPMHCKSPCSRRRSLPRWSGPSPLTARRGREQGLGEYIKKNNLQNPAEPAASPGGCQAGACVRKKKVTMFEMNKHLAQHLS